MTLDQLKIEAQCVLNELWSGGLIPFQLTAHYLESQAINEYKVRFCDSRIHSVYVSATDSDSFRQALRVNLLARVARLDEPRIKVA